VALLRRPRSVFHSAEPFGRLLVVKTWLRLTLITMTVGGGFTGIAVSLNALAKTHPRTPSTLVILVLFVLLYAVVTIAGLLFVVDPRRTGPLAAVLILQIPRLSSPIAAFKLTAGGEASIDLVSGRFSSDFLLGSDFSFSFLRPMPWGLGINCVAVILLVLVLRARPAPAEPRPDGPLS